MMPASPSQPASGPRPASVVPPTQQSGCTAGCLRGCLIMLAVLLMAAIIAVVAFQTVGRPWIAGQLPAWRQANPWLDFGIELLNLGGDLTSDPNQSSFSGTNGRKEGVDDKSDLPADVVVYMQPKSETYSINAEQITGYQLIGDPVDKVSAYFRDAMAQQGWQLGYARTIDSTTLFIWQKQNRSCEDEIVQQLRETEFWLRCAQVEPTPAK